MPAKAKIAKSEWFESALELLLEGGIENVCIEKISRRLGIAKSSFYWHFTDRDELLQLMFKYWASLFKVTISSVPQLLAEPNEQTLFRLVDTITQKKVFRYDLAIRAWASKETNIASEVAQAYQQRMKLLRFIFAQLGFNNVECERRARLFMTFFSWESYMMFSDNPEQQLEFNRQCLAQLLLK
jgi:AcrR family transcriptional regulator